MNNKVELTLCYYIQLNLIFCCPHMKYYLSTYILGWKTCSYCQIYVLSTQYPSATHLCKLDPQAYVANTICFGTQTSLGVEGLANDYLGTQALTILLLTIPLVAFLDMNRLFDVLLD